MTPLPRAAVALVVASVLTAGCARPGPGDLEISARPVAIDVAFANAELTKPIDPEVIIQLIPAPPSVVDGTQPLADFAYDPAPAAPPPALPSFPACPLAPPGAAPKDVATPGMRRPPASGRFTRHNTGTIRISSPGIFDLQFPYPFFTADEVSPGREIAPPPAVDPAAAAGEREPPEEVPGTGIFQWDVRTIVTPQLSVTNTYRLNGSALLLVRRQTRNGASQQDFMPQPPIEVLRLNEGEGATWRSAGVDNQTRPGLTVEGRIESREAVDVCGELVDAYRVVTTETFVDLSTGSVSSSDEPNVTHYATQLGGLIVRSEQHATQQLRDPETGTPVTLEYDVVSTIDAVDPGPPA